MCVPIRLIMRYFITLDRRRWPPPNPTISRRRLYLLTNGDRARGPEVPTGEYPSSCEVISKREVSSLMSGTPEQHNSLTSTQLTFISRSWRFADQVQGEITQCWSCYLDRVPAMCYSWPPLEPLSARAHLDSQLLSFVERVLIGISSVPRF